MRMRAADDHNDSSNHMGSPAYHTTPSGSPQQQQYPLHRDGESPVLTELLPSRPVPSGTLRPGEGHQVVTLLTVSPAGTVTPRLPEGYDTTDQYPVHQLSYQGDSHTVYHHYSAVGDDYGRSVSDSESGYHTPESSPYSQNAYSHCSPPTVSTATTRSESTIAWVSPTSSRPTNYSSKDECVDPAPDIEAGRSLPGLTETPCYLPATLTDQYSESEMDLMDASEETSSPGSLKNPNEVYGEEDRQKILDNLLTRKPVRISETENMSPVSLQSSPRKSSGSKKRRRRTQTPVQRKAANMRERKRMCHLNVAFDKLKDHLPNVRNTKKLSRIQTLRAAIYYIGLLTDCLHM